jgi:hypothetical protein
MEELVRFVIELKSRYVQVLLLCLILGMGKGRRPRYLLYAENMYSESIV